MNVNWPKLMKEKEKQQTWNNNQSKKVVGKREYAQKTDEALSKLMKITEMKATNSKKIENDRKEAI